MLNYINKHKGLSIVIGLSLILLIILIVIFASLFLGNGESKYGNRLDGIEEVKLTSAFLNDVNNKLKEDESVEEAKVRLQGKIVYIVFEVKEDVDVKSAKQIATNTLEKFSEEEKAFYDISYLIKWTKIVETEDGETKEEISAIEGTKHPQKDSITWSKS